MRRTSRLSVLAVVFALGALAAWTLGAAGRTAETTTVDTTAAVEATTPVADTTTESTPTTDETATTSESVTEPSDTTAVATTTVQVTTTRLVTLPTLTTTSTSSESGTEDWVWVLLAILAAGLVALIALLARRGKGTPAVSTAERRGRLDAAVASWTAQGWAIESDTADSVQLRRGAEAMLLTVDASGHVSTHPLQSG
jgi:hypothetical protein